MMATLVRSGFTDCEPAPFYGSYTTILINGRKVFDSRQCIMRSKSKQSRTVAVMRRLKPIPYTGQTYDFATCKTLHTAEVGV